MVAVVFWPVVSAWQSSYCVVGCSWGDEVARFAFSSGCTASPGRDKNTGCTGWSHICDHAAAVPAVRRVLRACGSVPRQNGGHSSCMQILVRTVHTVPTVEILQVQFWRWFWARPLLCNNRCLGWVAQCLVRRLIHVMHHPGWLLEEFLCFSK